jgi:radical SAM protein (TIGR01212 family)
MASGRRAIAKGTRAQRFIAYFQAYTNTYGEVAALGALYERMLAEPGVAGISVGTRPDCVPEPVLQLLAGYRKQGLEVWLELGLQSAFDDTLKRVNRGHGLAEYRSAVSAAHKLDIPVCTHLIIGLPGETEAHYQATLDTVLELGVEGLKLHPLHVVKGSMLANQWRRGEYQPLDLASYVRIAADLIERTPEQVIYHRVTATAPADLLLAPSWCAHKWHVLNGVEQELQRRGHRQGRFAHATAGGLKHVA